MGNLYVYIVDGDINLNRVAKTLMNPEKEDNKRHVGRET